MHNPSSLSHESRNNAHRSGGVTAALLAGLALAGCTSAPPPETNEGGAPPGEPKTSYYRDIKPVLDAKCVSCHAEGGIGPFALDSYEAAKPYLGLIKLEVENKTMPPWPPGQGCADYHADRSLSDEQIALISAWIDEEGPEGDPKDEGAPLQVTQTKLSRVDVNAAIPMDYVQKIEPDDYRCFVLDWPETTTKYVTGFRANPGDARVVHHVIAFLATPDDVAKAEALDAAEEGPGYTCYGSSGIDTAPWLGAWAPGGLGSDFPPGTGLRVDPGSKLIIQVHYNSLTAGPQPDRTSVDFKLEDTVEKEAVIQPWAKPAWLSGDAMLIPAGQADTMHSWLLDPTPFLTGGDPFIMYSASLHMHQLGTRAMMEIQHPDGTKECLLNIQDWNFHWQGSYGFVQPKVFNPGDKLYLECHWDNAMGKTDVTWGEGTQDEMCLGAFYMTPP